MTADMAAQLVCSALSMAITSRRPAPGLIVHSDRGSQPYRGVRGNWTTSPAPPPPGSREGPSRRLPCGSANAADERTESTLSGSTTREKVVVPARPGRPGERMSKARPHRASPRQPIVCLGNAQNTAPMGRYRTSRRRPYRQE